MPFQIQGEEEKVKERSECMTPLSSPTNPPNQKQALPDNGSTHTPTHIPPYQPTLSTNQSEAIPDTNRVWCSGTSVTLINLSTSPARGSTPRIRVIFCIFRLYLLLLLCLFINLLSFFSTFVIRFILAGARVFIWLSCGDGLSGLSYLDHLSPFCPRLFYLIITLSDQRKQKIGPKGFSSVNHSSHIR